VPVLIREWGRPSFCARFAAQVVTPHLRRQLSGSFFLLLSNNDVSSRLAQSRCQSEPVCQARTPA
jgi:hypothetical protein